MRWVGNIRLPHLGIIGLPMTHEFYPLNLSEAGGEAGANFPKSARDKDSGVDLDL
jgi:hypothetical protein